MKYILLFAILILTGCNLYYYNYKFRLDEPSQQKPLYYENDTMAIGFKFTPEYLQFNLQNKISDGIKINWEDVSLSIAGSAYRTVHIEPGMTNKSELQPPTTIPPGSHLTENIVPADFIEIYRDGPHYFVHYNGMFPNRANQKQGEKILRRKGDRVVLYMPFSIAGNHVIKTFNFSIEDIQKSISRKF